MTLRERIRAAQTRTEAIGADERQGRRGIVKVRAKRAVLERVGFEEVARIAAAEAPDRARDELRPVVEAVLNADFDDVASGSEPPLPPRSSTMWWAWVRCSRFSRTTR